MTLKKLFVAALTALAAFNSYGNDQADNPKREFRGAWIHTIFQSQYSRSRPTKTNNTCADCSTNCKTLAAMQ